MIIQETVSVKISPSNVKYWREKGYVFENTSIRKSGSSGKELEVDVKDLAPRSTVVVECLCEECGEKYKNRIYRRTDKCKSCLASLTAIEKIKRGKLGFGAFPENRVVKYGSKNGRFNPNKSLYKIYLSVVSKYTRVSLTKIDECPGERVLLGKEGFQLDHKVSCKYGFMNNIPPQIIGSEYNLQWLSTEENRNKWHNNSITTEELFALYFKEIE